MSASRRLGVLAIMMMIAQPAWAHHAMDGKLPQTFLQGLLSGFGHPVIGVDHLAAIVGVGILAALAGRSAAVVLAFSVAVIAGVGLHLSSIDLPASELFVGLTTLLIGALVIAAPVDERRAAPCCCSPSPGWCTAMRWANRSSAPRPRRWWLISSAC